MTVLVFRSGRHPDVHARLRTQGWVPVGFTADSVRVARPFVCGGLPLTYGVYGRTTAYARLGYTPAE